MINKIPFSLSLTLSTTKFIQYDCIMLKALFEVFERLPFKE
jgi:hypothetical protein